MSDMLATIASRSSRPGLRRREITSSSHVSTQSSTNAHSHTLAPMPAALRAEADSYKFQNLLKTHLFSLPFTTPTSFANLKLFTAPALLL
jgi:hypothetical protein